MTRLVLAVLLLLLAAASSAGAQTNVNLQRVGGHIASATTTTLVAAQSGLIEVWTFTACVSVGGTTTTITVRDGAGTNLFGTNYTPVIAPGMCYVAYYRGFPYGRTAAAQSLQLVTNDVGPVEYYLEYTK